MVMSLKDRIADGLRLLYCDIRSAKWAVMFIIAYFVILKKLFRSLCPMVLYRVSVSGVRPYPGGHSCAAL